MIDHHPPRETNHLGSPPLKLERRGYGSLLVGFAVGMLGWIVWHL
jgi:hypothetical protein